MKQMLFKGVYQFVITLALCLPAAPVLAGIVDSPLPVLVAGKKTLHVYSVTGVMSNVHLGTYFACTSTNTATMQVGVELFFDIGDLANNAVATSLSVIPGQTVIFGTGSSIIISTSSNLATSLPGAGGSARVLSTSSKLICTAFVADPGNAPPTSAWHLTVVKQKTQKGE